jgi:hypothetical protein
MSAPAVASDSKSAPAVADATMGGALALSPAAVGGRRHMKKVSAKTIRRTLKKLGMKPKGRVVLKGGDDGMAPQEEQAAPTMAGKRKTKKAKRRSASKGKLGILGL